ncbi:MAG: hypothetical protein P8Y70_17430 [Candidatus Lokiarchaeota archaeon]
MNNIHSFSENSLSTIKFQEPKSIKFPKSCIYCGKRTDRFIIKNFYGKFNSENDYKNNYEIQQEVFGQDYYMDNGLFDYLILTDYDKNGNWVGMKQIYPLDAGKEVSPQELKEMLYTGDFSSVESSSSRYTTNRNTANEIYNYTGPAPAKMTQDTGADAYGPDAVAAVKISKKWIGAE